MVWQVVGGAVFGQILGSAALGIGSGWLDNSGSWKKDAKRIARMETARQLRTGTIADEEFGRVPIEGWTPTLLPPPATDEDIENRENPFPDPKYPVGPPTEPTWRDPGLIVLPEVPVNPDDYVTPWEIDQPVPGNPEPIISVRTPPLIPVSIPDALPPRPVPLPLPGVPGFVAGVLRQIFNPVSLILFPSVLGDSDLNVVVPAPRPNYPPQYPWGRSRSKGPRTRRRRRPRAATPPPPTIPGAVGAGGLALPTPRWERLPLPDVRAQVGVSDILPQLVPGAGARVSADPATSQVSRAIPDIGQVAPPLAPPRVAAPPDLTSPLPDFARPVPQVASPAVPRVAVPPKFSLPFLPLWLPSSSSGSKRQPGVTFQPGQNVAPAPTGPLVSAPSGPLVSLPNIGTVLPNISGPLIGPNIGPTPGINPLPLTSLQPAELPFAGVRPIPRPLEQTQDCSCRPAQRKQRKRKKRSECWRGTYVETATSTRKTRKEKVSCRRS